MEAQERLKSQSLKLLYQTLFLLQSLREELSLPLSSLELAAPSLKGLTVTRAAGMLAYLCLGSRVTTFFKTENTTHFYLCIFNENCVTDDSFRLATLSEVLAMLTSGGWMMWEHCTCWGTNSRT